MITTDLLRGTRILDLTSFLSGPLCTQLLAALGAEVIKIERPGSGDGARRTPPYIGQKGPSLFQRDDTDVSLSILKRNRGKKSLTLNLATEAGRRIFQRLLQKSDAVVENFSPGVMDRLGLSYETLESWRPGIVLCSISGFGQEGPWRNAPAFDLVLQALSGIAYVNGHEGRPPIRTGPLIGDQLGAVYGALAIVAGLKARDRTGRGEHIDVSLLDALMGTMWDEPLDFYADQGIPIRTGNRLQRFVPSNFYRTSDGYVSIMVGSDGQWESLLAVMGLTPDPSFDSMDKRVSNADAVDRLVEQWTKTRPTVEVVQILSQSRVPCAPVLGVMEAAKHPQVVHRGLFTELSHPDGVPVPFKAHNMPVRFRRAGSRPAEPAPKIGQDTEDVLRQVGGYTPEEIEAFKREGAI